MAISAKYACDVLSSQIPLTPNYDEGKTAYISAYGVFEAKNGKKVIVRAADHGTYLFHWADRNEGVDLSQSANYAITFKDSVEITHKTEGYEVSALRCLLSGSMSIPVSCLKTEMYLLSWKQSRNSLTTGSIPIRS